MGFHDFLENQRRPVHERAPEYDAREDQDNYENREEPKPRRAVREEFDEEDSKALDEVDFYKQRLYKKIDSCFIRYGLVGLQKIDEGIAESLTRYIDSLKRGVSSDRRAPVREGYTPNYRKPPEAVRYEEEEEIQERSVQEARPQPVKPFKKPTKIEGSNPNPPIPRRPGEPKLESGAFNQELLNAILTDVIPPTEIHEVEINSSIPRQPIKEATAPHQAEVTETPENEESAGSNYDIAKDMLAGVETDEVDLIVPPVIEEAPAEDLGSEEDFESSSVETIVDEAPVEVNESVESEPKKRKKKK